MKNILRKLPWYLLLGHKNSGKTSLLANTGLNFSLIKNLMVSSDAVILDTLDNNTIKLIKRYRRNKGLNGILIVLSLPELLLQPDNLKNSYRQEWLAILQKLYRNFRIQIPVYLILTKCDLIAGFQPFFNNLNKEERAQPWGITFPSPTLTTQQSAVAHFNTEYDRLVTRLQESLLLRLETERDPNKRLLLSYFPQQMQFCKKILADCILQNETLQWRGIYFISNFQNGKPYDFVLSALSVKYRMTLPVTAPLVYQEKTYFSSRLFSQIILPEVNYIRNSPYLQKLNKLSFQASWGIAVFTILFVLLGLSVSFVRNQDNIALLQHYLPEYQQAALQLKPDNKSLVATLPLLNIVKEMRDIYSDAPNKWLLFFELYQPYHINNILENIQQRNLASQFMPRIAWQLGKMLRQNQKNPEQLYHTLKAYLVFSPTPNTDPNWLRIPIAQEQQDQINALLDQALQYPIDNIPLDQNLIEKSRARLRRIAPVEFAYDEMQQEAAKTQAPFNLSDKLGANFNNVFTYQHADISALYTLDGYFNLRGSKSKLLLKNTAKIYGILGLDKNPNIDELAAQMTPALWARYSNDYVHSWQKLLANIQIAPFTSLQQATQTLDIITSNQSPLLAILLIIKANTATIYDNNIAIAPQFSTLNAMAGLPKKPAPQYTTLLKNLTALHDYLNSINNAPNMAQIEFQEASAYLQNKTPDNPIAVLKKQAQQLPAPLNRWVNEIADNSFALLLQGAHETINTAWKNNVAPIYQANIQKRFPFNNQADTFVNITSFGNFFGSGGVLLQFFQTYLQPFIDTAHTPWRQYQVGNYSLGLNNDTLIQLQRAALIRRLYFPNDDKNPAVQFYIQPRFLDSQSSSVYVQLADQNLTYRHGPQQPFNWHWPLPSNTQQVNVSFSDFQGQDFSMTLNGPWAWFKLLATTQLQATGAPGHYIWTINQNQHQASFDIWTFNDAPLFDLSVLESFALPEEI